VKVSAVRKVSEKVKSEKINKLKVSSVREVSEKIKSEKINK